MTASPTQWPVNGATFNERNQMKTETHNVIGELLDALWRGICIAACFAVCWPICIMVIKRTPSLLKLAGVWQ